MDCPICGWGTAVADSRPEPDCVNRRRKCLSCNHRFDTIELEKDALEAWAKARNASASKATKPTVDLTEVRDAIKLLKVFWEREKND